MTTTVTTSSYFDELFGGFALADEDGAMKLAFDALLGEHLLGPLADMLSRGTSTSGVGGEPGWTIRWGAPGAERERPDALVIAEVEPDAFRLDHPEARMRRDDFLDLVERGVAAYEKRPGQRGSDDLPALKRALSEARSATAHAA